MTLVHADDRARMVENLEQFLASDAPIFTFEHRLRRADGSIVHVKGAAEYADWPSGGSLVGVVHWTEGTAAIHDCPGTREVAVETAIGFYTAGHRERITDRFWACANEGKPFDEVLQILTATGRRIWVHTIGEPERDLDGSIVAVRGAFQDVTELVLAHDRSRGLARHLASTLDTMSDRFFTLDRDWRLTDVNQRAEELVGIDRRATLGKSLWELYPVLVSSRLQREYETAVATGEAVAFQNYFAALDRWYDLRAYPLDDGLAVYFRDVTEAKAAEEALALSEERFRLVALASNDVVWDWDAGTIWWNDSFDNRFGYPGPGPETRPASRYRYICPAT